MGKSTSVVSTSYGPVEVRHEPGDKPAVLLFPGGHTNAATPLGEDIYTELGHGVLAFSRPGYGRTDVGPLSATEFVPAVVEACHEVGVTDPAAAVGASFGGLQAIQVAVHAVQLAPLLVLHSCAPSGLPYPDSIAERLAVPVAFSPTAQRATWAAVRRLVASDRGLARMMTSLSSVPIDRWWASWSSRERELARSTFRSMDSGSGFGNDVRQASAKLTSYRTAGQRAVACPTLITASRFDGGVAYAHAENFAATIRHATVVDTQAPSHFYWIGQPRKRVAAAVASFLS